MLKRSSLLIKSATTFITLIVVANNLSLCIAQNQINPFLFQHPMGILGCQLTSEHPANQYNEQVHRNTSRPSLSIVQRVLMYRRNQYSRSLRVLGNRHLDYPQAVQGAVFNKYFQT